MIKRVLALLSFIFLFIISFDPSVRGDFRQVDTYHEYVYDFTVSGGASNTLIDVSTAVSGTALLPLNAVIKEVTMKVLTTFTSSGGASLTVGNTTSGTGYFLAKDISEFTDNAVFKGDGGLIRDITNNRDKLFLIDSTDDRNIGLTVTAGTPITAGKARISIKAYTFGED